MTSHIEKIAVCLGLLALLCGPVVALAIMAENTGYATVSGRIESVESYQRLGIFKAYDVTIDGKHFCSTDSYYGTESGRRERNITARISYSNLTLFFNVCNKSEGSIINEIA